MARKRGIVQRRGGGISSNPAAGNHLSHKLFYGNSPLKPEPPAISAAFCLHADRSFCLPCLSRTKETPHISPHPPSSLWGLDPVCLIYPSLFTRVINNTLLYVILITLTLCLQFYEAFSYPISTFLNL